MKPPKILNRVPVYLLAAALFALSLLPFYVLAFISLNAPTMKLSDGIFRLPDFYLLSFAKVWEKAYFARSILNSTVITAGALLVTVSCAAMAGYAVARFPTKFNMAVLAIFLFSMMIPGIINTVPLYVLMRRINGINSYWAMILLLATGAVPFSAFLYWGFIKGLSREIEESAIIDGCSWFTAFWKITFPFLKPVTAAVVIIQGLGIWNNYAQAMFFLQSRDMQTIPLAISNFFNKYGADWNQMAAAAVIGMMPAVAAFLLFQKFFIKGLTAGALKG